MANEQFDAHKREGNRLGAAEMNRAFSVLSRLAGMGPQPGTPGTIGASYQSIGFPAGALVQMVEITAQINDQSNQPISGMYLCKVRFYDRTSAAGAPHSGVWRSGGTEWPLDATSLDQDLTAHTVSANGSILSAWWNAQRGTFIPVVSAGSTSSWYQLLSDMDTDDTYYGYANPGEPDSATGFLVDSHAGVNNASYTVLLVDGSGQVPCWIGDWVQGTPLSVVISGHETYSVVLITNRASSQLSFWGQLGGADLSAGGSASATLLINGTSVSKTVWDGGLLNAASSQVLPGGSVIYVSYHPDLRRFDVEGAACQIPA